MHKLIISIGLPLTLCLALGCGGDFGDHCNDDGDCPDKCQTGGGFPEGICTKECNNNAGCPAGWSCITKSSGICMKNCTDTSKCSDEFGSQWVCDAEALQEGGGSANVCIGK